MPLCADADVDLGTLITRANTELKKIALWFRVNKMAVNIGKTKFIVFHNRGKKVDLNGLNIVYDDNEPHTITSFATSYLDLSSASGEQKHFNTLCLKNTLLCIYTITSKLLPHYSK